MKILSKNILAVISTLLFIFVSSCANRTIINVEKDIRRIDIINNKGNLIKSYYEKYSNDYSGWLKANCNKKEATVKCKFTTESLNLIDNSTENLFSKVLNSNEIQTQSKNLNSNNKEEEQEAESQEQEEGEGEREEEGEGEREEEQERE